MKIPKEWWLEIEDLQIMPMPRHRPVPRRPPWIIISVSLVCVLLTGAYFYPPGQPEACYFFSSSTCSSFRKWLPPSFVKVFTDDEIAVRVIVVWGKISMVDAEKRLLANALQDTDNQHFILLSDSCVPLHNFDYVYNYLMDTNVSFINCFEDPGPHGTGRYLDNMLPEIGKKDWRKGAQWFSMKRQHALLVLADSLYYLKFKNFCKMHVDFHSQTWKDAIATETNIICRLFFI